MPQWPQQLALPAARDHAGQGGGAVDGMERQREAPERGGRGGRAGVRGKPGEQDEQVGSCCG